MILDYVSYFPSSNTFEVRWVEEVVINGVVTGYAPVKTHSYASTQAGDFAADLGSDAQKYLTMAGWTV